VEPSNGGLQTLVTKCVGVTCSSDVLRFDAVVLRGRDLLAPSSGCTFLVRRALGLPVDHILVTAGFKLRADVGRSVSHGSVVITLVTSSI
jgi:hypothetical protein